MRSRAVTASAHKLHPKLQSASRESASRTAPKHCSLSVAYGPARLISRGYHEGPWSGAKAAKPAKIEQLFGERDNCEQPGTIEAVEDFESPEYADLRLSRAAFSEVATSRFLIGVSNFRRALEIAVIAKATASSKASRESAGERRRIVLE